MVDADYQVKACNAALVGIYQRKSATTYHCSFDGMAIGKSEGITGNIDRDSALRRQPVPENECLGCGPKAKRCCDDQYVGNHALGKR